MKRTKSELKKLAEHFTKIDDVNKLGQGQFSAPLNRQRTRFTGMRCTERTETQTGIRIGQDYQAVIPPFSAVYEIQDRGDVKYNTNSINA